jgi:hypothetical protein
MLGIWILSATSLFAQTDIAVSGYVYDDKTGESLIGVSVYTSYGKAGTLTNSYGFFSLSMGANDTLEFSYLGYDAARRIHAGLEVMKIRMKQSSGLLKEAEIKAKPVRISKHGMNALDMQQLNRLPAMGGERDLLKAVQLLPGVKKGADGTVGMMVRGGSMDQNLILLDDAPVYNPSHLLGFFSLFNTDAIREVNLQSGGYHASCGGRLSSVLDVRMSDGNSYSTSVTGSAGLLASGAMVQGPLPGNKGSYLLAGRVSYVNQVYALAGKDLPFYFYDLNGKMHWNFGKKDKLFLSFYTGDDILNSSREDSAGVVRIRSNMGNRISSVRWNHAYSDRKTFSNFTVFNSVYRYRINAHLGQQELNITANIQDLGYRLAFTRYINSKMNLAFGTDFIKHALSPNSSELTGEFSDALKNYKAPRIYLEEAAIYTSLETRLHVNILLTTGIRLSSAKAKEVTYYQPEPRLSLTWNLNQDHAITASYAWMTQYMFLLSSGSSLLPTDLWYGVDKTIKPQHSQTMALGYQYEGSATQNKIEFYYKPMQNLVEYREGTTELITTDLNEIVVQGKGEAYGMEYMHKWNAGKWNITGVYTLSWSTRTFKELNDGNTFPMRYDRRHDFNIIIDYRISERISLTTAWSYASGSRITPVIGQFMMPNGSYTRIDVLPVYASRNGLKLADAHKLDINLVIKNKPGSRYTYEWHMGAYNAYNQTQPYRLKLIQQPDGSFAYKQVGLFGFIPSVSYRFKF